MVFQRRDKRSAWQSVREIAYPSKGLSRPFSYIWLRIKRRPGTPEYVAKGFAIGMLISFTPLIGAHVVGAIFIAWMFRADALAAVFASLIINAPVTFGIIFPLTYRVGKAVMNLQPRFAAVQLDSYQELLQKMWPIESWTQLRHITWELFLPMTIGGFVTGIPVSIGCYYIVRKAVIIFKEQRSHLKQMRLKSTFNSTEADIEKDNPHAQ